MSVTRSLFSHSTPQRTGDSKAQTRHGSRAGTARRRVVPLRGDNYHLGMILDSWPMATGVGDATTRRWLRALKGDMPRL